MIASTTKTVELVKAAATLLELANDEATREYWKLDNDIKQEHVNRRNHDETTNYNRESDNLVRMAASRKVAGDLERSIEECRGILKATIAACGGQ